MFLSFKLYTCTILQYWTIFYNPSCATRFVTTNINLRYTFPFTAKHFFERKHINTLYVWDVFKCNSVINLIIVNRFFNKKKRGFFYYNGYNVNPAIELLHIIYIVLWLASKGNHSYHLQRSVWPQLSSQCRYCCAYHWCTKSP